MKAICERKVHQQCDFVVFTLKINCHRLQATNNFNAFHFKTCILNEFKFKLKQREERCFTFITFTPTSN